MDGKLRNMTALYVTDRTDEENPRMLMLYRIGSKVVDPSWCGIGGHFEPEEVNDARACVLREAREEIGLTEDVLENLRMRYIALRQKNGEIRHNYYFFADLKPGAEVNLTCDEGIPKWVDYREVCGLNMPYSAKYALEHYMETGRHTENVYVGAAYTGGMTFAMLEEI